MVEHQLPKLRVAGSIPVSRSLHQHCAPGYLHVVAWTRPAIIVAMKRIGVDAVVVLMTISEGALKTLLVHHADDVWSLPGDALKAGERLSDAARRVVKQQAGIEVDYLEQLFTFGDSVTEGRPRLIEVAYYGLVPSVLLVSEQLTYRKTVRWYTVDERPKMQGDHAAIMRAAVDRLRGKMAYTAVGFELLPESFSLAELQSLYEIILGKELDKRNFRKKINELGILEATGEERSSRRGRGRPASLFRFRHEVFSQIETKGDIFPF